MTRTRPINVLDHLTIDYDTYSAALKSICDEVFNKDISQTIRTLPRRGNSTFILSLPQLYPNKRFVFLYTSDSFANQFKKEYIRNGGTFDNNGYPYFKSISSPLIGLNPDYVVFETIHLRSMPEDKQRKILSYIMTNVTNKFLMLETIPYVD